jgi:hypothetical protein
LGQFFDPHSFCQYVVNTMQKSCVLDFERLIQNVDSLLQAFREVFQLQMTKDDPLSIAMK